MDKHLSVTSAFNLLRSIKPKRKKKRRYFLYTTSSTQILFISPHGAIRFIRIDIRQNSFDLMPAGRSKCIFFFSCDRVGAVALAWLVRFVYSIIGAMKTHCSSNSTSRCLLCFGFVCRMVLFFYRWKKFRGCFSLVMDLVMFVLVESVWWLYWIE